MGGTKAKNILATKYPAFSAVMELSSFYYFKHVLGDAEIYLSGLCLGTVP